MIFMLVVVDGYVIFKTIIFLRARKSRSQLIFLLKIILILLDTDPQPLTLSQISKHLFILITRNTFIQ
jgi:hypothetical protein